MSHTPEPWAVSDSPYGAIVSTASRELRQNWCVSTEDTGRKYSDEIAVANARRIVACVNACEGIPIEWLESNGSYDGWMTAKRSMKPIELPKKCESLVFRSTFNADDVELAITAAGYSYMVKE